MDNEIKTKTLVKQIVNEYLEINMNINSFLNTIPFIKTQSKYVSIGILGPSKTGKSTLINRLFNTQFPIHSNNSSSKGLFMSYYTENQYLLFDNEGLDSSHRSDNNKNLFDYVTSIMCYLLCDIILMNILYTDIGRFTASGYHTITLFYEQALLSKEKTINKKKLVYLIRDYDSMRHNRDKIYKILKDDLNTLWSKMNKRNHSSFEDYFILDVITLPHHSFFPDQFTKELDFFGTKILDASFTHNLPISNITSNDVSRELLEILETKVKLVKSQYSFYQSDPRLLMVFYNSLNHMEQLLVEYKNNYESFQAKSCQLLPSFKYEALELRQTILKKFDSKSKGYNEDMCYKVKNELDKEISFILLLAFNNQIIASLLHSQQKLRRQQLESYMTIPLTDHFVVFDSMVTEEMNSFIVSLIEKKVYDKEWLFRVDSYNDFFKEAYNNNIKMYFLSLREQINEKMTNAFYNAFNATIDNYYENKAGLWGNINKAFRATVEEMSYIEEMNLKNIDRISDQDIEAFIKTTQHNSYNIAEDCYKQYIIKHLDVIVIELYKRKMLFLNQSYTTQRQWNQYDDDEIEALSWKYKADFMLLFDTLKYFKLDPYPTGKESSFNIFNSFTRKSYNEIILNEDIIKLKTKYHYHVKNITEELKFQSRDTKASVPLWLCLVIIVLGRATFLHLITTSWVILVLIFIGTYIIITQMKLTSIFRSHYYTFEYQLRHCLDKLWSKDESLNQID